MIKINVKKLNDHKVQIGNFSVINCEMQSLLSYFYINLKALEH